MKSMRLSIQIAVGLLCCVFTLDAPAQVPAEASQASPDQIHRRAAIVPMVDHHQHLLGPSALPPLQPLLPAVQLPEPLQHLLNERSAIYGHASAPASLDHIYTDRPLAISWEDPSHWVQGREELRQILNAVVSQTYQFIPNAFQASGSSGFISGYVAVIIGGKPHPALDFLLAITKDADGVWKIAAESTTIKSPPRYPAPITAEKLVRELDDAGIKQALVLSVAYWLNNGRFPDPADEMTKEYAAVRSENDWVAAQVARYPNRLVMACSANVLRAYAILEMERCAKLPQVRAFKLHFADAAVDLRKPEHLAKVQNFFKAANRLKMPLVIHFAPRFPYGREYVDTFLTKVVSYAPDIPIQIAHLGGDGPGIDYPEGSKAFAAMVAARAPGTDNLYFDIAGLVTRQMTPADADLMVSLMRQIGLKRILYGSDGQPPNKPTMEHWLQTRRRLPLSDKELTSLAANVAPYLAGQRRARAFR